MSRWGCAFDAFVALLLALVLTITVSRVAEAAAWLRLLLRN